MDPLRHKATSSISSNKAQHILKSPQKSPSTALKVLSKQWETRGPSFVDRFKSLCHKSYASLKNSIHFTKINFKNPFCLKIPSQQTTASFNDDEWSALIKDLAQYLGKEAWSLVVDNILFLKSIRDINDVWTEKSKIYEASEVIPPDATPGVLKDDVNSLLTQCQDLKNKIVHTIANPKDLLTEKVQKNVLARLGWSLIMLTAETLAMIAKLVKLLALIRIPFAYALGESIQGFAHLLRAGLQIQSQASGVFAVSRAFGNAAKANEVLKNNSAIRARESSTNLEDIEKKAVLKAIKKQQQSFERFVNLADKGFNIASTLLAATTVTIAVLAATGVASGMALVVLSPVGWGVGIIGLTVTLTYGSFCIGRYFHNFYKKSLWEACLESAQKGPVRDDEDLASRGKVYEMLYKQAQEKIESGEMQMANTPDAINAYIEKRGLSRLLQMDSSLLLETIYESVSKDPKEDDLGQYLSSDIKILSQDLVNAIRLAKSSPKKYEKAHKPYLMRELMYALAV